MTLTVFLVSAMLKKPVVTEVRTPTNTWSGLGFSKSMPAETIKELRRANHVSYKPTMSTTYEVKSKNSSRWEKHMPPMIVVHPVHSFSLMLLSSGSAYRLVF